MTDKELLDLIKTGYDKKAQEVELPDALSKENIVAMLNSSLEENKEPAAKKTQAEEKSKKSGGKIVMLRRLTALAASLVVLTVGIIAVAGRRGSSTSSPVKKLSPEAIEEYILHVINGEGKKKDSDREHTKKNEKAPTAADVPDEGTQNPPPGTGSDVTTTAASLAVTRGIKLVRADSQYIYRLVNQTANGKKETKLDIISITANEVISSVTVSDEYGECFDMFTRGNTLALISKTNSNEVNVRLYDLTDPAKPGYCGYFEQSGAYVYEKLCGGKLCIITRAGPSNLQYAMNGDDYALNSDNIFTPGEGSGSYCFITITDIDNLSSSVINYAVDGNCDKFSFTDTGLRFASENAEGPCLYRFVLSGNSLKNAGEFNFSGEIAGELSVSENGTTTFVSTNGSNYKVTVLNANMEEKGSAGSACKGGLNNVFIGDSYAFISTPDETAAVNLRSSPSPTITVPVGADGFSDSRAVMCKGGIIVGEGMPASDGEATWSIMTKNGECTNVSLDSKKFTADLSRPAVGDDKGEITGFPVISGGKPAYLFLITDAKGSLSSYSLFVYEGSSDDVCLIKDHNLCIISANRVKTVPLAEVLN